MDGDGFIPAHRLARKTTPWAQAAAKPAPKGTTVNQIMESAFAKHARLEASRSNGDDVEVETVGPPLVPAVQRAKRRVPRSVKRKLSAAICHCPDDESEEVTEEGLSPHLCDEKS